MKRDEEERENEVKLEVAKKQERNETEIRKETSNNESLKCLANKILETTSRPAIVTMR